MKLFFLLFLTLLFPIALVGQYKTVDECKRNQEIEKKLVLSSKLTKIERVQYVDGKAKTFLGREIFYFNSLGLIVKKDILTTNVFGNEKLIWTGKFVYNSYGLCDSLPVDKGMVKAKDSLSMYPTCYNHLGRKKLKDGLIVKLKYPNKNVTTSKVKYIFRWD